MAQQQTTMQDDFLAEVYGAALDFPGSAGQPIVRPKKHLIQAHHWKAAEIERLTEKAAGMALGERRMLRLANPGTPGWKYATQSLSVSVQQILPNEIAVPHRHTANAIRFFLKGSGAYTTVENDKCIMEPGDLIVTPGGEWHDYGGEGNEAGVWLDALDLPLVQYLDAMGYLETLGEYVGYQVSDETQLSGSAAGLSEKRYSAAGLKPMWDSDGTSHRVGLIHYRWASTYAALCRLAETEVSPFDDVILEYVNPATGKSLYPTFTCCVQMIRPGVRTRAHRHTSCAVYYVFQGKGHSVVGDRRFDWAEGDLFVVPTWFWHEHGNSNGEPAVLFSIHDFPAMKSLGIYHEIPHPDGHLAQA